MSKPSENCGWGFLCYYQEWLLLAAFLIWATMGRQRLKGGGPDATVCGVEVWGSWSDVYAARVLKTRDSHLLTNVPLLLRVSQSPQGPLPLLYWTLISGSDLKADSAVPQLMI
jgi:hypothetical protein